MTQTSDDIARESDQRRAHVSGLIDELRSRLTAGEVIDEMLSSEGLHQFTRNFGNQVKSNPLALTMIGGGLAWLIFSGKKSEATVDAGTGTSAGYMDSAGSSLSDAKDKMTDMGQAVMDKTKQAASDAADSARGYAQKAKQSASDMADKLKNTKPGATLERWAREQPLLLAGVGLAMGLLLGAGVPLSETENELLGEESDRFRSRAAEMAHDGISRTKEATQAGYQAARETFRGSADGDARSSQYH